MSSIQRQLIRSCLNTTQSKQLAYISNVYVHWYMYVICYTPDRQLYFCWYSILLNISTCVC